MRTARLNSIRESNLRRKNCAYNVELRPVALARIQGQSWKRDKANTLNKWYFILPLSQQNTSKKYLAMTQFVSIIVSKCCITRVMKSTRLHHMWPGFESWRRRHMWVEFVVGSLLYSERFLYGYSGFTLPLKTNTSNKFQFDLERTDTFQRALKNS